MLRPVYHSMQIMSTCTLNEHQQQLVTTSIVAGTRGEFELVIRGKSLQKVVSGDARIATPF